MNEQELREKLLSLRRPGNTELEYGKTLEVFTDELVQLITQYRDMRERLGRIDELDNPRFYVDNDTHADIKKRLAELKEEV